MFGKIVLCFMLTVAGVLFETARAQDAPLFREVEGWEIRVDKTLGDGCFAAAIYEGFTVLRIGYNANSDTIYFMVGDPKWKSIELGKSYPLEIKFGNESPWEGDSTGVGDDDWVALVLEVQRTSSGVFLREFMEEQFVEVIYNNQSIATLRLRGSYKAGLALIECQGLFENRRLDNSDPFRNRRDQNSDPFADPFDSGEDPFRHL